MADAKWDGPAVPLYMKLLCQLILLSILFVGAFTVPLLISAFTISSPEIQLLWQINTHKDQHLMTVQCFSLPILCFFGNLSILWFKHCQIRKVDEACYGISSRSVLLQLSVTSYSQKIIKDSVETWMLSHTTKQKSYLSAELNPQREASPIERIVISYNINHFQSIKQQLLALEQAVEAEGDQSNNPTIASKKIKITELRERLLRKDYLQKNNKCIVVFQSNTNLKTFSNLISKLDPPLPITKVWFQPGPSEICWHNHSISGNGKAFRRYLVYFTGLLMIVLHFGFNAATIYGVSSLLEQISYWQQAIIIAVCFQIISRLVDLVPRVILAKYGAYTFESVRISARLVWVCIDCALAQVTIVYLLYYTKVSKLFYYLPITLLLTRTLVGLIIKIIGPTCLPKEGVPDLSKKNSEFTKKTEYLMDDLNSYKSGANYFQDEYARLSQMFTIVLGLAPIVPSLMIVLLLFVLVNCLIDRITCTIRFKQGPHYGPIINSTFLTILEFVFLLLCGGCWFLLINKETSVFPTTAQLINVSVASFMTIVWLLFVPKERLLSELSCLQGTLVDHTKSKAHCSCQLNFKSSSTPTAYQQLSPMNSGKLSRRFVQNKEVIQELKTVTQTLQESFKQQILQLKPLDVIALSSRSHPDDSMDLYFEYEARVKLPPSKLKVSVPPIFAKEPCLPQCLQRQEKLEPLMPISKILDIDDTAMRRRLQRKIESKMHRLHK